MTEISLLHATVSVSSAACVCRSCYTSRTASQLTGGRSVCYSMRC